jgi:uncharacterized protein YqfA (UPF0365 family)
MSLKERFPRVTGSRVLILLVCVAVASLIPILFGGNEWVSGITAGVLVAVGSILGTRWRNQDARRANDGQDG